MAKKDQTEAPADDLSRDQVTKLATAIARANNHSQPEEWAAKVADHYSPPEEPADLAEGSGKE